MPRVSADATLNCGPPSASPRLPAKSPYRRTRGRAKLSSSARLLRSCTVKSASRSALKISDSAGVRRGGETGGVLTAFGSLTEITSRETDEDVLERDLASSDREHIGVVFVLLDQTGRCVDGQDLAVVHDRDAVAHRLRLLHRMRGQEDAPAAPADALDSVPKLTPRLRVEAGRRLVNQDERRVVDCRDEQRQALLLPARQLAEAPGRFVAQMDFGQAVEDRRLCERDSVQAGVELDDLADLELGLKARGLELNADERFGQPGVGSSVHLADQDRAGGRLEQSLDRAQGACLAGSVRTQKPEDLAFVDIERDPIHRSLGAVADA